MTSLARRRSLWLQRLTLKLALVLALAGCGGGASFVRGVYDDGTVRYRVGSVGSGWQRVEVDENDLAFNHERLGTISVNSTCREYEDVPDQALLNHLLFGMRERNFRLEETVTLDGRGALHTVVDVELDGVPVTLEIYLVQKDGCVYDLSLITARPVFESARPSFASLVRGFEVLSTSL